MIALEFTTRLAFEWLRVNGPALAFKGMLLVGAVYTCGEGLRWFAKGER
jgi:hypothetical protein